MWAYTAMPHFFLFMSFLQVRDVRVEELQKQVDTGLMVPAHLRNGGVGAKQEPLTRCFDQLKELMHEVKGLQLRSK